MVVGVAISYNPPTAHCYREAISFVLILGIASCSVGSGLLVGKVNSSSWATGVGVGAHGYCLADFGVDYCMASAGSGWRFDLLE